MEQSWDLNEEDIKAAIEDSLVMKGYIPWGYDGIVTLRYNQVVGPTATVKVVKRDDE